MASHATVWPAQPRRTWLAVLIIVPLAVALLNPAPARAAPSLKITPASGYRGAELTAVAKGFTPGPPVTFLWDADPGEVLGTVNADGLGEATLAFEIPGDASFGVHTVRACQASVPCPPSDNFVDAQVTVLRRPQPSPTPAPTPKPTPAPTPTPTASPTAAPSPNASPTATSGSPTPVPASQPPIAVPTLPPATPPPVPPILVGANTLPPPPDQLVIPTPEEFPNLRITAVEVTQGIQDLENNMPLVAGRRTYARVYVSVIGAETWGGTYGGLHATRNGQSLGWIWPEDGAIVARADGGSRLDPDDTLDFRLPESWTAGDVRLTAFIYSYHPDTPFDNEPSSLDNIRDVDVTFHEGEPLTVHYATLHLHLQYDRNLEDVHFGPSPASIFGPLVRTSFGYLRYHPIADVNVYVEPSIVLPIGHYQGEEFDIGWCDTTIASFDAVNHLYLEDWTILVEEPDPDEEGSIPFDYDTLWIGGVSRTISSAYVADGGQANVFTSGGSMAELAVGAKVLVSGCKRSSGYHLPNVTLAMWRAYHDWADEREAFVGMIDPSLPGRFGGLSTGGTDTVWVRMNDEFFEISTWYHRAAATAAHETAHAAGLKHVPCKDDDNDDVPDELKGGAIDVSHPEAIDFPDCSLADESPVGFMGFDVYHDLYLHDDVTVLSNDPTVAAPNRAFPFMSYESPTWPDPYHYCRLLPYYGVPCDPDEVGIRWNRPHEPCNCDPFTIPSLPSPATLEPLVLVWGEQDPETGQITVHQTLPLPAPTTRALELLALQGTIPDAAASAWLVVRDGDGRELRRVPLDAAETGHEAEVDDPHLFTAVVELPDGASRLVFEDSAGREVGEVPVSNAPPEIAGLALEPSGSGVSLAWRASDPDGDPLAFAVLYSPDGEQWQMVGPDVRDARFELTSLDGLPGSPAGRFRVVASDGLHAATAESAPFAVADAVPMPIIHFPRDGAYFALNGTVIFEGSAFDLEDRGLPGDALAWSSSLDGALGTGREVRTATLSAGRHVIKLVATDSAGSTAEASVEIVVDGAVVQAVPGADTVGAMDRIFDALASGAHPAPVRDHPDFLWLPIGITVVALLAVAGGLFLRGRLIRGPAHEATHVAQGGGASEMMLDDTAGAEDD